MFLFFFQAEDGIRDGHVTGVQTCALPICLALLGDGTVMAWGANFAHQLGNGGTTASDVPVPVSGLSNVRAVSAGREFSLALLSDGTVMAWGANVDGQLGDGSTASSDVPVS